MSKHFQSYVEIIIREFSGEKLDSFICKNNNDYRKVIRIIYAKYGFTPYIKSDNLAWLNKDID